MALKNYSDYVADGGEPTLTGWVKSNWLAPSTPKPPKPRYLVIKDLDAFNTSLTDWGVPMIKWLRNLLLWYDTEEGQGLRLAQTSRDNWRNAYLAGDKRTKTDIKFCRFEIPDNITTVDEAFDYVCITVPVYQKLATSNTTTEEANRVKATLEIREMSESVKWWCADFLAES